MKIKNIHTVYFVGIGGMGMSALALHFKAIGKRVLGYDKTSSEITKSLQNKGIDVFFDEDVRNLEPLEKSSTLVVYTPAVPTNHSDIVFFKQNDFQILKRSEVLGLLTKNSFCFAVAGTHGKTTVTTILAHLLKVAEAKMVAFLGGISENYNTNYICTGYDIIVVEADEFDKSFLKLYPDVLSITSIDADHLDIYDNKENVKKAFKEFASKIQDSSRVFVKEGLSIEGQTFSIDKNADYQVVNIRQQKDFVFDIKTPHKVYYNVRFNGFGTHNLLNALTAFSMALQADVSEEKLIEGLSTFQGVKRRFSFKINRSDFIFIDDYAHHPAEIDAVYNAVRYSYPNKKIMAVFQPHLFSRTLDFAEDFAKSLSQFDCVALLEIYPARETPMDGVTSGWLLSKINSDSKKLVAKDELIDHIKCTKPDVLLTLGAGDIGEEVERLKIKLS